jgi:predicted nucleotidyltransferase component of viral defense system
MNNWDNRYAERVKLLVEILPTLAEEKRFALKGGTAINLFEHDLPRLSVDIDLTWLPVGDFANDTREISAALEAIGERLHSGPLRLQVQTSGTEATGVHRLLASRNRSRVQIETTPVMRGTVHPVRTMRVRPGVEQNFGFAEIQVLDFADLYAGKLSAALSRQHPRDLFDLQPLLAVEHQRNRVAAERCHRVARNAGAARRGRHGHPGDRLPELGGAPKVRLGGSGVAARAR